jgi:hypothetical protein
VGAVLLAGANVPASGSCVGESVYTTIVGNPVSVCVGTGAGVVAVAGGGDMVGAGDTVGEALGRVEVVGAGETVGAWVGVGVKAWSCRTSHASLLSVARTPDARSARWGWVPAASSFRGPSPSRWPRLTVLESDWAAKTKETEATAPANSNSKSSRALAAPFRVRVQQRPRFRCGGSRRRAGLEGTSGPPDPRGLRPGSTLTWRRGR